MPISKIGSKGVKDAEISAADIAPGTITSAKIAPGTIASDRIAPGTIASDRLAGGITNSQLAGSIANAKLANSSTTINGTAIALGASGTIVAGTDWQAVVTSNTTMVASRGYFVNTTGGAITMTLPASPSIGDFVEVIDYAGTATTNNITIARNGSNIGGAASDPVIDSNRTNNKFTYVDATQGWVKTNDDTGTVPTYTAATGGTVTNSGNFRIHTFNSSSNFVVSDVGNDDGSGAKVSYIVVAGGGGGGEGGGGAGGYREGRDSPKDTYSASPLAASNSGLTVSAQTYPITVGAGGNGQQHTLGGLKGSNSVFSTITSTGGGGGGPAPNPRVLGGSGGGREPGVPVSCQSGNHPPVSPPQGNPGGEQSGTRHGGGGGAGGAGATNAAGAGVTTSINASAVARAGGGIGGHSNNPNTPTSGVAGGGGINSPGSAGGAGTANTGGGGSGGWSTGGNAGSGIVIIRYKYQN